MNFPFCDSHATRKKTGLSSEKSKSHLVKESDKLFTHSPFLWQLQNRHFLAGKQVEWEFTYALHYIMFKTYSWSSKYIAKSTPEKLPKSWLHYTKNLPKSHGLLYNKFCAMISCTNTCPDVIFKCVEAA